MLATGLVHRLAREDLRVDDPGVGLPGEKEDVAVVSAERHVARLESLLSEVRKLAQLEEIPGGMREFVVELVALVA